MPAAVRVVRMAANHGGQLLEVVGLLGQLGRDHDLLAGGGLGVVALQGSAVAAHKAARGRWC